MGLVAGTILAALLCAASPIAANALPDPTRPPAALHSAPAASSPGDALMLQSVLLGKGRTPAAVISGELVLLGGQVRGTRLVRITERHAVLKGPLGETVLALLPSAGAPVRTPAPPESTR
ncbi:MAG TPA: MSHA biogenesis protein MshK [Albitalea sp.]